MRCKRPARFPEDHTLAPGRDVLKTMGLAGAAAAATAESSFPVARFEDGEEVVPFTDVADVSDVPAVTSAIVRVTRTPAARFKIFGVAWTDGTPLASVEVKVDDGSWLKARLDDRGNSYAWTFFTLEVDALAAGEHRLVSRAIDAKGRTQPETLETKKTYWEDHAQFRRTIAVA